MEPVGKRCDMAGAGTAGERRDARSKSELMNQESRNRGKGISEMDGIAATVPAQSMGGRSINAGNLS